MFFFLLPADPFFVISRSTKLSQRREFRSEQGGNMLLSNPSRRRGERGNNHGEKIFGRDILPGPFDFCYSGCLSNLAVPRFPMPSSWIRAMQIFKSAKLPDLCTQCSKDWTKAELYLMFEGKFHASDFLSSKMVCKRRFISALG